MPNAINPMFIFIGDEGFYDMVSKEQAKNWSRVSINQKVSTKDVLDDLMKKYSVYLIRKPYGASSGDGMSMNDKTIYKQWASVLGEDRIAILPEAGRVVDVIFGLMANETDRIKYFRKELEGRQTEGQVNTVLKSLNTVHALPDVKKLPSPSRGKSIMNESRKGKEASKLI